MLKVRERTIIALDVDEYEDAARLVDLLSEEAGIFKVGIAPFTAYGEKILEKIAASGKQVFLDLKIHDIPNTVRKASRAAAKKNIFMMNFHCSGGLEMLKAAKEGAEEIKNSTGQKTVVLGVTVLTSMDDQTIKEAGFADKVDEQVERAARLAKRAGLDGVVCSAREAAAMKHLFGKDFITVTPGIRPGKNEYNDQKRVATPAEAFSAGSDYIVIGRPVIGQPDPAKAFHEMIERTEEELLEKENSARK